MSGRGFPLTRGLEGPRGIELPDRGSNPKVLQAPWRNIPGGFAFLTR
jgi:hypothetical protein